MVVKSNKKEKTATKAASAKPAPKAVTEPIDAAAVPVPKRIVENTPANKVPAPSVAAPKKTEAGPTLKPRGTKAASKDIEPAVVVIPIQNMKESKKALVKAADNLAAQVQCVQPIWTRKPDDIEQGEYDELYKSITKDKNGPVPQTHFITKGEVTFMSLHFVPNSQPSEQFNKYGQAAENIKLYFRRVFITDDFKDMMPSYHSFVKGVVDSDDLPLNVSKETLQQHELLKVIKKKPVRKTLDMIKKISVDKYEAFWAEYSTYIKLGVMEDTARIHFFQWQIVLSGRLCEEDEGSTRVHP